MLGYREWDGTHQDLLYATACAIFQFSAVAQPDCRELLMKGLLEWFSQHDLNFEVALDRR